MIFINEICHSKWLSEKCEGICSKFRRKTREKLCFPVKSQAIFFNTSLLNKVSIMLLVSFIIITLLYNFKSNNISVVYKFYRHASFSFELPKEFLLTLVVCSFYFFYIKYKMKKIYRFFLKNSFIVNI